MRPLHQANLDRAQRALRAAAEALGRRAPSLRDLEACQPFRRDEGRPRQFWGHQGVAAQVEAFEQAGKLLADARAAEVLAKTAGDRAAEALRAAGGTWAELGAAAGMTPQGAQRRYQAADAPEPQLTIADA